MDFSQLVSHARAGTLADARADAGPEVLAFLDAYAARLTGLPMLLACASEDPGPVGEAGRAWIAANPHPAFLRRAPGAKEAPRVVIEAPGPADGYALDVDASGRTAVVVDHGSWPDGHDILVYDVPGRRCRAVRKGDPRKWGESVSVAPDGSWAVVGGGRVPLVVDLRTDTVKALPKGHRTDLGAVAVVDHDSFVACDKSGMIKLWRRDGRCLATVNAHPGTYVMGLAVHGDVVWSIGFDHCVRSWRLPGLTPVASFEAGDGRQVRAVAGGDVVVSGGRYGPDGTARFALPAGVITVDEAGRRVFVVGEEGLSVHDLDTGERLGGRSGLRATALAVAGDQLFVLERYRGTLTVHSISGLLAEAAAPPGRAVDFLLPSPDGRFILTGTGGGGRLGPEVTERGACARTSGGLALHRSDGSLVAGLPGAKAPHAWVGPRLLTREEDGALTAWDPETGAKAWSVPGGLPEALVADRSGRVFATGLDGDLLTVGAGPTGEALVVRDGATGASRRILGVWAEIRALFAEGDTAWFSTDRSVGAIRGGVLVWEVPVDSPRSLQVGHGVLAVASGATLVLLDAASGATRAVGRSRSKKPLTCVAFAGGRVWTGGQDGRIRAWDPATGAALADFAVFRDRVHHLEGGADVLHAIGDRWRDVLLDVSGAVRLEPFTSCTGGSLLGRLVPEGAYGDTFTVHELATRTTVDWVGPRANGCVAAVGSRVFLGWRIQPGPLEVLEWVAER